MQQLTNELSAQMFYIRVRYVWKRHYPQH